MFNKNNRFYKYLMPSLTIFILAVFLLTFSVKVNSASAQTYFPMDQNENNLISDNDVSGFINTYNASNKFFILKFGEYLGGTRYKNIYYVYFDGTSTGSVYGVINSNGYQFNLTTSGSVTGLQVGIMQYDSANNRYYNNTTYGNALSYLNNSYSSLYTTSTSYRSNFNVMVLNGSESDAILWYDKPLLVPSTGHAQNPSNNIPTIQYPIGMHPTSVPTVPQYTAPSLTNAPTIDTSSVSSILESIYNLLAWVLESIVLYIANFINTFVAWLQFLGNLIVWLFENYIDFLKSLWMWLYNIFEYLFSPIYDFLTNFFKFLFNEDDQLSIYDLLKDFKNQVHNNLQNLFSNSWFSNYWTNFEQKLDDAFQYFSKIVLFFTSLVALGTDSSGEFAMGTLINNLFLPNPAEVAYILYSNDEFDVFSTTTTILQAFPILFNQLISTAPSATIHIPSLIYHGQQIGDFDVDFSWYSTYKVYVDVILNAFLIIGYIYWLFITFGSHLRGHFMDYEPNNPDSNARLFKG